MSQNIINCTRSNLKWLIKMKNLFILDDSQKWYKNVMNLLNCKTQSFRLKKIRLYFTKNLLLHWFSKERELFQVSISLEKKSNLKIFLLRTIRINVWETFGIIFIKQWESNDTDKVTNVTQLSHIVQNQLDQTPWLTVIRTHIAIKWIN